MPKQHLLIYALVLAVFGITLFQACDRINSKFGIKPDNQLEEAAEAFIEYETGLDVDLTPASPENGSSN